MILWTDEQLEAVGIDKKSLESLVRRLKRCSNDMKKMGLHIYGASGQGFLIHHTRPTHSETGIPDHGSSVASLGLGFDGGDM